MKFEELFLDKEHLEKYYLLVKEDSTNAKDIERLVLFFVIAGVEKLYKIRKEIYSMQKHCIYSKSKINSIILSSSERNVLLFGLNLYNSYKCNSINETFSNLDLKNTRLLISALKFRFLIR